MPLRAIVTQTAFGKQQKMLKYMSETIKHILFFSLRKLVKFRINFTLLKLAI